MHRTFTLLFFLVLIANTVRSQTQRPDNEPPSNRWINFGQSYYKIPIAQPGLYRITATELRDAGVPLGTLDPTTLQLFHRGVEQAMYVEGEADKRFDVSDFLEFYGRSNDGTPDSLLYRTEKQYTANPQPHTYYSLFSDTTAYFLTWRSDGKAGKRMGSYADTDGANLTPDLYHWQEDTRVFTDTYPGYPAGITSKIEYSFYEAGEGYTGPIQQKDKPFTSTFVLSNAFRTGPPPQVDVLMVGQDYTKHYVESWAGPASDAQRPIGSLSFSAYDNGRLEPEVSWSDVNSNGQLLISTVSRGDGSGIDRYSVSYIRLRYPQKFTTNGRDLCQFRLAANAANRSLLTIAKVVPGTRFWDVTNPNDPIRIGAVVSGDSARLVVHSSRTARMLLSANQPKSVPYLRPIRFVDWANRRPSYLIVTHEALMKPAGGFPNAVQAYAAYRASAEGGNHDTLTVTMQQLFDQFSYGERHPLAIRRFTAQMLRQGFPQYLLLLGRSRSTPGVRHNAQQADLDMVMTAGFPGSDVAFTAGLDSSGLGSSESRDVPAIPTGRINASTPQQIIDYLSKVKEFERASDDGLWRKNILHLSGGDSPSQAALLRSLVDSYRDKATNQSLGAHVTTLSKETDSPLEHINVAKPVNEGVGLMTFFGHSGLDVTDLNIGFCSDDALGYRNKGKYPVLLINGCAIGNFFFGRPTLTTDWVLTPNRGAIAAIAHSHLGYVDYLNHYSTTFYDLLADSTQLDKSIGQLQQETIRRVLARSPGGLDLATCQQMVLQGDPAIRPFPFTTPDYVITAGGVGIQGADGLPLTTLSDSVRIRAVIRNTGQHRSGRLPIRINRYVNGRQTGVFNLTLLRSVAYLDTFAITIPNERDAVGTNQFEVTVNATGLRPDITQPEVNRNNNTAIAEITLAAQKPTLLYPPPGDTVRMTTIRLIADYRTERVGTFDLELDTTARFNSPIRLQQRITTTNTISHQVRLLPQPNTTYYWRVRQIVKDSSSTTGNTNQWSTGSFVYASNSRSLGLPEGHIELAKAVPTGIQQGDAVAIPVQFANLSPYPYTDSLVVRQTIYASNLAQPQTTQWRLKAPAVGDTLRFITTITTETLPGINRVVLTVNPRLQPEYSFLNNTLDVALPVQPDQWGPVIEAAFDGARIDDGAVVSAQPVIDVLVADDNRSLIRRDTTGLNLFLQNPGKSRYERLNWRRAVVQPTGADNLFRISYPSPVLAEGEYQLLVTAQDAVGNQATPYRINFRIVNERKLTNLTVFPNPFRDKVRFRFQLTGNKAPDAMTVTITDVKAHIVRHLSQPGHIGLNELTWDGCADSGEQLPAGVYVYTLSVNATGQNWSVANDSANSMVGRLILTH
ncbi:C25 family cysteine peptidase [Spirosoma soli]|uniref:C25 family cysteine peptidase n=1 Tax=Spirosoma soli TaxID=1770529 RepID=A0ABW5M2J2_9BACT